MFPNDCGSFIQRWSSIWVARRFSLRVALPLTDLRVTISVNFWVAIRVNFWVTSRFNFWVATCFNHWAAMFLIDCGPHLLGWHLLRRLGRVDVFWVATLLIDSFGASFVRCFDLLAGTLHFFFGAAGRLCSSGFIVPTPSGTPVVSRGNLADGGG